LANLEIVAEVGDGPGLVAALEETRPDFLLIDVTMPDFEPISAIHQIRAEFPAMKILVISAFDDDVYVQGLLRAGVNGYHLKDQSLSDLKFAVQRILAGERWVSSRLVSKLVSYSGNPVPVTHLSNRQRELLMLLQQGLDNQSIARRTGLSIKTVENHLTRLYRQLNVQSRLEAVKHLSQHPEVLAVKGQQSTASPSPEMEICAADQIRILLVDDNARYRRQLRRMVGKVCPQAVIHQAENIQTATRLAQQTNPELIFVDVVLGDEDGIHCTRQLKTLSPSSRIILISAYPDREFHRRGIEAGAVAFLDKKDLDAAALRQVIDDVIA